MKTKLKKVLTYNSDTDMVSTSADDMLYLIERSWIIKAKHVYVILEHGREYICEYTKRVIGCSDAEIHGVYLTREAANTAAARLMYRRQKAGYISVLKFRVKGY